MRIIAHEDDILEGVAALALLDPRLKPLIAASGAIPLRRRAGGYEGLCRIVVSQQVSVASAAAIWGRVEAAFQPFLPEAVAAASLDDLKACGLSAPKIRTLKAVATAILQDGFRFEDLPALPSADAIARLTAIKGIGPWSAELYLMFCLGAADAFCAGDLALQEALKLGFGLPARPNAAELEAYAEKWRPWRAVAARLLWAYYHAMKTREGV